MQAPAAFRFCFILIALGPSRLTTSVRQHPARSMITRKKVLRTVGAVIAFAVAVFLGYGYIYQPLKYRYLVSRVESARTTAEEQAAFRLAAEWGRIWQIHHVRPEDAAAVGRSLSGDWLLKLEWLESSPYRGRAYVAYRAVTDTNNLRILWDKKY